MIIDHRLEYPCDAKQCISKPRWKLRTLRLEDLSVKALGKGLPAHWTLEVPGETCVEHPKCL